jgi:hypothetical protein
MRYRNDVISLEQWLACLVAEGGVQAKTPRKIWKYAIRNRRMGTRVLIFFDFNPQVDPR